MVFPTTASIRFKHTSSLFAPNVVVITLYCWIFTFDEEVMRVWKGKVTGATVMFILNRYLGLLYSTLSAIQGVVSLSDKVRLLWIYIDIETER